MVLVDYWRRHGHIDINEIAGSSVVDGVKWPALATLGLGTAATLLFFQEPGFYQGLGARLLFHDLPADISSFVGVGFSAALFVALMALQQRARVAR